MKRNVFLVVAMMFLCVLILSQATPAEELTPTTLTWVAGGVGGGWYVQAGGLARLNR